MKLVTGEIMAEIDRQTIQELGIPGVVLMERAGGGVAEAAVSMVEPEASIMILCGRGNNGGDGFVAARLLAQRGFGVKVFLLGTGESSGDAGINYRIVQNLGLEVVQVEDIEALWEEVRFRDYDLMIDALLGTGLRGPVRGIYEEAISFMNAQKTPVLSVDIPSGIDSGNGSVLGQAVEAIVTVSFGVPKVGNMVFPGCTYNGELRVVDIGIPQYIIREAATNIYSLDRDWARAHYPYRPSEAHKGSCGRILVVGGAVGMTGAPAMAAMAALRAGAGVVTLAVPASLNSILEVKLTEVMTLPLPESKPGYFGKEALPLILDRAKGFDFMVLGPGLGRGEEIDELVGGIIENYRGPLLLDADGLNAVSDARVFLDRPQPTILTPHYGEMARLLGMEKRELVKAPYRVAGEAAGEWGVILVLKGPNTLIALPEGTVYVNTTGNPGMATAGAGDVLSGAIAGLTGQRMSFSEAGAFGVFLHGLAGDLAVKEKGIYGIAAADIIDYLPRAWKSLQEVE